MMITQKTQDDEEHRRRQFVPLSRSISETVTDPVASDGTDTRETDSADDDSAGTDSSFNFSISSIIPITDSNQVFSGRLSSS